MNDRIESIRNTRTDGSAEGGSEQHFRPPVMRRVREFHRGFGEYAVTPLRSLTNLAQLLGVSGIYVKDESYRFGLNAFKVLGGSYAIGCRVTQKAGLDPAAVSLAEVREFLDDLGGVTFATATDGNHGRGVAWTAARLGQKAVVYMPRGSAVVRVQAIAQTGAQVCVTDLNYDDTVRLASETARREGWELIQDTAWDGYRDVPLWIMQGYGTIAVEAVEQLPEQPTHIFLQAGVGSFPAALAAAFTLAWADHSPKVLIVEPKDADCFFRSAQAGSITAVAGDLDTIMAGLACGEPNPVAWDILARNTHTFVSVPDWVAARGMRLLGNPLPGDERVISGESGAVTTGLLSLLSETGRCPGLQEALELDTRSRVLLINTEGDTDPEMYRRIVWDGAYPNL